MSNAKANTDKESLQVFNLLFDFGQKQQSSSVIRISHFWTEKVNICLQLIQLFSLIFTSNYDSWPVYWQGMYKSSHLSLFAGDLGVLYYTELYSNSTYRLLYSGGWVIVSVLLAAVYLFFRFIFPFSVIQRVEFQRIYFKIVHFMYLPIALGLLPPALCQYSSCVINGGQLVISILTLVITVGILVGYPVYLIVHVNKQVISTDSENYDEFIRLKEIEFLLGVSSSWLTEKLYLFSSYRSSYLRIYHRSLYYAFVLTLVAVHAAINTSNKIKLLVQLIICFVFSIYITVLPVYRSLSSAYLYAFSMWLITSNVFIGFLKASNYQSQTMIDSNLINIIVAINVTGLVLIVILLLAVFVFQVKWDVGIESVKQLAVAYRYLLNDLRNSEKMILTLRTFNNFKFVKKKPVQEMINLLKQHYELLSAENHPLQYTVVEQLDILGFMYKQIDAEALPPNHKLDRDYHLLVKVVNRRWKEQILMTPVKRKLLLKLGVLKMFLGSKATKPFNSGDTTDVYEKNKNIEIDYDINKLVKEMGDLESSREVEFARNIYEEIDEAVEHENIRGLIKITEDQIEMDDPQVLHYLKSIWKKLGPEKIPQYVYQRLFRTN